MPEPERIKSVLAKNLRGAKKDSAAWTSDAFNRKLLHDEPMADTIEPFLQDGSQKKLIPDAFWSVGAWHIRQALQESLNGGQYSSSEISLAGIYAFWYIECAHAIMESDDPAGYTLSLRDFDNVSFMLALGWPDHALRLADTIMDRWDAQEGGPGNLEWDVLPQYTPWLSIKLFRAWTGDDTEFYAEPDDHQLDGFAGLAQHVLDNDEAVFAKSLIEAADFHVLGSDVDDYSPVNNSDHWFFPVQILAACRIRELKGLSVPHVEHPLFDAAPMCRLQPAVAVPDVPMLAKLLPAFAEATQTLDLEI